MSKIKILIVDDHPLVRRGINDSICTIEEFEIVGQSESGEEALLMVREYKPDVLITDISMGEMTGIMLCKEVSDHYPDTKAIILSMHKDPIYIIKSFEVGAMAYLPKESDDVELQMAIKEVHGGKKYLNEFTSKILAEHLIKSNTDVDIELTSREEEILGMIVDGHSNKQIGFELSISERTVDTHRTNIMRKLNARNTADMVRIAIHQQLV